MYIGTILIKRLLNMYNVIITNSKITGIRNRSIHEKLSISSSRNGE